MFFEFTDGTIIRFNRSNPVIWGDELNEVPSNYFADVEQSAFAPAHLVDGIKYSPDKMLQGRLLSYPSVHRYRRGGNYEQILLTNSLLQLPTISVME